MRDSGNCCHYDDGYDDGFADGQKASPTGGELSLAELVAQWADGQRVLQIRDDALDIADAIQRNNIDIEELARRFSMRRLTLLEAYAAQHSTELADATSDAATPPEAAPKP